MKKIYSILLIASTLFFFACQQEEKLAGEETGYLRLSINEDVSTNARADVPANYDAEKIGVQILNAEGKVQESLEPWEIGTAKQIKLPVGTYTLKASSAGWDGQAAGFDIPYYTGSEEVTITAGAELSETITCTLANVKVSTVLYPELLEKVSSVTVKVYDESETYSVLFSKTTQDAAYFPVVDALYADITIVSDKGTNTLEKQQLCNAEGTINARDHYILNIKPQDSGNSQISVEVDPTTHEYTYTFSMSTKPSESVTLSAGAWDRLAYLQATDIVTGTGVSMEGIKFQYREKTATAAQAESEVEETWNDVVTTSEADNKYTAMLTGLTASTTYEYRVVNAEGVQIGTVQTFTTDTIEPKTTLYNGNFDGWYKLNDKTWYPVVEEDVDPDVKDSEGNIFSFWDSGNAGTSIMSKNPTAPEDVDVNTAGGKAGVLISQYVGIKALGMGKFAAGNVFTGHFCKANMSTYQARILFGQPFTSRPVQLKGSFKYNRGTTIDNSTTEDGDYKSILEATGGDLCSIYIALVDNEGIDYEGHKYAYEVNGDLSGDDVGNFKYKRAIDFSEKNSHVIAYGSITDEEAKGTGEWQDFTINLEYRDMGRKPKYIIIVASASKYGDYFTGSEGSTLYVDDFSLVYEGTPSVWKNK